MILSSIRAVALATTVAVSMSAQSPLLTEDQARKFASDAAAVAKGDPDKFDKAFRDAVRTVMPGYSAEAVFVHSLGGLDIWITGPISEFQRGARLAVRKMESVDKVEWSPDALLSVLPSRIDAPNIEKVVITRGGQTVEPIRNQLSQNEAATAMGGKVTLGAGSVSYPMSAFAPGAEVIITAIPKAGQNIVKVLKDGDLKKLR